MLGEVLHPEEARHIIQSLKTFDITEYSSPQWAKQHQQLERLNMQAHVSALMKSGEYIMDECVSLDKLKMLIYDLVLTEIWKKEVYPHLRQTILKSHSPRAYTCLYHQSVVLNLLQILMYHRTAVQQAEETLLQLIDYCYRKLVWLSSFQLKKGKNEAQLTKEERIKKIMNQSPQEEQRKSWEESEFSLAMMAMTIVRYITDFVKYLQIGMMHHLVVECDILCLLVPLIELKPWLKVNQSSRQVFQNGKWLKLQTSEYGKLPKIQAQAWLAIYNLFMDPDCRKKYQLNQMRKSNLLRLRKYMNEVLLDQIPNLTAMLRALEELSMMSVPAMPTISPFIVQQMPPFRTGIMLNRDWRKIAESQLIFFSVSQSQAKEQIKRMADLYSSSTVEGLMEGFKCNKCKKESYQRCKQCKSVWYCSRDCQKADWPIHSVICKQIVKEAQAKEQKLQTQYKRSGLKMRNQMKGARSGQFLVDGRVRSLALMTWSFSQRAIVSLSKEGLRLRYLLYFIMNFKQKQQSHLESLFERLTLALDSDPVILELSTEQDLKTVILGRVRELLWQSLKREESEGELKSWRKLVEALKQKEEQLKSVSIDQIEKLVQSSKTQYNSNITTLQKQLTDQRRKSTRLHSQLLNNQRQLSLLISQLHQSQHLKKQLWKVQEQKEIIKQECRRLKMENERLRKIQLQSQIELEMARQGTQSNLFKQLRAAQAKNKSLSLQLCQLKLQLLSVQHLSTLETSDPSNMSLKSDNY